MNINIRYRPLAGILSIWNSLDDSLSDKDRCEAVTFHNDNLGEEDYWHYRVSTYRGQFLSFTALGVHDEADAWNIWLAKHLPDEVIAQLWNMVQKWDDEWASMTDDESRILANNHATITVA